MSIKIILSELIPEILANSPESLTALIAFPILVKVSNRPIKTITITSGNQDSEHFSESCRKNK